VAIQAASCWSSRRDERIHVATGFAKWGLSKATIAARIITDTIVGRSNRWAALYDTRRLAPHASASSFVAENARVTRRFVGDRLRPRPEDARLAAGEGAIIRAGHRHHAVYCDESGTKHVLSARCPHLGCLVAWSEADKGWECPCHGSRFTADGELLQGPATTGLEREPGGQETVRRRDARFAAQPTAWTFPCHQGGIRPSRGLRAPHLPAGSSRGATFGLELVQRCRRNNEGTEFGEPLAELTVEIAEDRQTLRRIMRDVGADVSRTKVAAGWTLEKIRRLKPNGGLFEYTPLARVVELESLAIGIAGKRAMWQALDDVASSENGLGLHDFSRLAERADDQLSRVEVLRLDAGRTAFLHSSVERRARASA
jgi:nitrite reductase/ring-hydroxylating ferredoxin subunit